MELRIAFKTLGCKLNQLESESLADAFRSSGARVLALEQLGASGVDLVVLNTCTVTGKAEQKARRIIRSVLAEHPRALVLVTGCYAQVEAATISALHERAVVVPGEEKSSIASLAGYLAEFWQGHGDPLEAVLEWLHGLGAAAKDGACPDSFAYFPERFLFHSRPSLKIQDGCDNRCSYCRVCIARGASRSLASREVLARLKRLEESGRAEVVLTGVNLSQYRDGDMRFPSLLRFLLSETERIAIRLSSYEPDGVNADFLQVFSHPRIRPHIHLALQSGSDPILARMARAYRRDQAIAACEALRSVREEPFLAADVIAGFPGEDDEDFENTLSLISQCRFAWVHAFPFSPRPGTRAWDMRPRVPERVAGERVAALGAAARAGREAYTRLWLGRELEAVLEGGAETAERPGLRQACSENYLKLLVADTPERCASGSAVKCRLEGMLSGAASESRSPDSGEHAEGGLGAADALAGFLGRA